MPVKLTTCGLFVALSVMVSDPLVVPTVVGVNATKKLHIELGGNVVPQPLPLMGKALLGLVAMLDMVKEPGPLL